MFDVSAALQRSTGRAKSDVANKLVSMFLHEISRAACRAGGLSVTDLAYREKVVEAFGNGYLYCLQPLEKDRAAVEHLNRMNRFRIGLHIPGNVAMACRRCNTEKRRDDQNPNLTLAKSGWESFLSHRGDTCVADCKSCAYWAALFPIEEERTNHLTEAVACIRHFQLPFQRFIDWSQRQAPDLKARVEGLYRDCQSFAQKQIHEVTSVMDFSSLNESPT